MYRLLGAKAYAIKCDNFAFKTYISDHRARMSTGHSFPGESAQT